MVVRPERRPTKKDCVRSVTVARTKALAGKPVSVQTDGGGTVLEQVCTPGTDDGKVMAVSTDGLFATNPPAVAVYPLNDAYWHGAAVGLLEQLKAVPVVNPPELVAPFASFTMSMAAEVHVASAAF
jgi:hypothetical protein